MSRRSAFAEYKPAAIEMRVNERLGAKEISRRLGVPIRLSTLHYWLKKYPLTDQEKLDIVRKAPRKPAPKKVLAPRRPGAKIVPGGLHPGNSGRIGEVVTEMELLKLNLQVTASSESDVVDFYVRRRDSLKTACIQVRCTSMTQTTGLPTISLRRPRGGNPNAFKPGEHFHFLVGYCRQNDRHYVFHWKEVLGRVNSITVTDEALDAWWKIEGWLEGTMGEDTIPDPSTDSVPARQKSRSGAGAKAVTARKAPSRKVARKKAKVATASRAAA